MSEDIDWKTSEAEIQKRLMLAISNTGARVFRNQVGQGWMGESQRFTVQTSVRLYPGDVVVRKARVLKAGLTIGSSDLIGWKPVTITADMVGKTIGAFMAVECKPERGKLTEEQATFIAAVRRVGGIALTARDVVGTIAEIERQGEMK